MNLLLTVAKLFYAAILFSEPQTCRRGRRTFFNRPRYYSTFADDGVCLRRLLHHDQHVHTLIHAVLLTVNFFMYTTESGQDIHVAGKSGDVYYGKIYANKNSTSSLSGAAIVCLSNSQYIASEWKHQMNSIYNTDDLVKELTHFQKRDDISHLIIIPHAIGFGNKDEVDDLIRNYLHG